MPHARSEESWTDRAGFACFSATVAVPRGSGSPYVVANVSLPARIDVVGSATPILMPASAIFALRMNDSTELRGLDFTIVRAALQWSALLR
eukprot:SAG31_NODE_610_length_13564_cov_3.189528_11_plen_91_part_00